MALEMMNVTRMPGAPEPGSSLDYALRYAQMGWHVFPVWGASNGKCRCGRECKSPGKHPVETLAPSGQNDATTSAEIIRSWYGRFPEAGIAVYMQPSGLVAIDIDPRNGGLETIEDIEARHGALVSDVLQFTQAGGEHRIFALPRESTLSLPGKLGPGIDVKRNGYIVLAPTRGISGEYTWEASSDPLEGVIPSPLPDWVRSIAPNTSAAPNPTGQTGRYVSPEQVLELRDALGYLSSDDYHQWINIGQALHSIGGAGFGLWNEWSRKSEKYDPAEMGNKWRGFRPGSYNIESIFRLASNAGWVNPLSKVAAEREAALQEIAARNNREKSFVPVETVSSNVLRPFPVPMLDQMAEWINTSQGIRPSVATQSAVLSIVSLSASRLYESESGDGAHIYQMLSAQTVGELRPLHNAVAQIIRESRLRRLLREQRFSSPAAFFKTLMRAPASLYLSADWGALTAFAKRQPSGVVEQVLHLIAHAYSQRDILLDNPEELGIKASAGVTDDMPVIHQPSLSVLALTSQSLLSNTFSVSEIGRGAIEQFLFHAASVDHAEDPQPARVPPWIIEQIHRVRRLPEGDQELDLGSIFNGNAEIMPKMTVVRFSAQPAEHYATFDALGERHRNARPLIMAARTNLRRMAVGMAAFDCPENPVVSRRILDWCAAFIADRLKESLAALNLLGGSEDGKASLYQAVLSTVVESGARGCTTSEIVRSNYRFRNLSSEKRDEMISQLINDEEVIEQRGTNGKGKRLVSAEFVREASK